MRFHLEEVQIVFFSGTGGTKRVADAFYEELMKREIRVGLIELGGENSKNEFTEKVDSAGFYILIFPVYAFDAPGLIYRWIESLEGDLSGKQAAVISVSGGGEVWPNTGCRNGCRNALEQKGIQAVYECMMCMPANLAVKINDDLAMWMIRAIPEKVCLIVNDLLAGIERRTKYKKGPVCEYLSKLERRKGHLFAQSLLITDACKSCGWCEAHCPTSNIQMMGEPARPVFKNQCMVCLRCVYGCPFQAIQCNSSVIFREGFDLDEVERRMKGKELKPVKQCCKGLLLVGVKKYLLE
ncbi:MAG: hypothetical protein K0Q48_2482 [Bacillota bacterium]|nr:hypothetical protein [Bacillota bacterium]